MCSLSSTKRHLVSGGVNCKQTGAVLCALRHHSQVLNARPREPLGRNAAEAVTDNVKRFAKNGWDARMEEWKKCQTWEAEGEFALKLAMDNTASFIRVTQTESLKKPKRSLRRYRVALHWRNC